MPSYRVRFPGPGPFLSHGIITGRGPKKSAKNRADYAARVFPQYNRWRVHALGLAPATEWPPGTTIDGKPLR